MKATISALAILTLFASPAIHAHGDDTHTPATSGAMQQESEATSFGRAGDSGKVTRIVKIAMSDEIRFSPSRLVIKRGETIRFTVHNNGKLLHEMVLGTDDDLGKHAELMRKFPEMEHAEPQMVHVKPGQDGDMIWTFDKAGNFSFACLIPGHFEAGMRGTVVVQ
ncbi:MAG: cupredoxin family protein [Casimicrobiaceae bacterium]